MEFSLIQTFSAILLSLAILPYLIAAQQTCRDAVLADPGLQCPSSLTCVYTILGNLALDGPGVGTCRKIDRTVSVCDKNVCEKEGGDYFCKENERGRTTTCGVFFNDGKCSDATRGSPAKTCGFGETCVYTKLGRPEVDVPGSGTCKRIIPFLKSCTIDFCANTGSEGLCKVEDGRATTCETWADQREVCNIACPEFCLEEDQRPCGSNGRRYCSLCQLQAASCAAKFSFTVADCSTVPTPSPGGPASPVPLPSREPEPSATGSTEPMESPTVGGDVGDICCDQSMCGIAPATPCKEGLTCVAGPMASRDPNVIIDAVFGKCQKVDNQRPTPSPSPSSTTDCRSLNIGFFDKVRCCKKEKIGCLPKFARCSLGGLLPQPPCEEGLTCVIDDLGNVALDNPSRGRCLLVFNVRKCNSRTCRLRRFPNSILSRIPCELNRQTVTCRAWKRQLSKRRYY